VTLALVLVPLAAGLLAFLPGPAAHRRLLLPFTACLHLGLTAVVWWRGAEEFGGSWLGLDATGLLVLIAADILFLATAVYAQGYLAGEKAGLHRDLFEEDVLFANAPEAVFVGCLCIFLSAMTLVAASRHLGLLWVGVEATTLATAPLIYYHRHHRSLEAAWKYLLICSVGIALALLGTLFLEVAFRGHSPAGSLLLDDLLTVAGTARLPWLKAAFILILVGYGTKAGLAPLHTWLPDAHGEAPSLVSALLSGTLLSGALVGAIRGHQLCLAAGLGGFSGSLLILFGCLSLLVAAVFIIGQGDYKRLLAYSSVEHMGIICLGLGVGGRGAAGALFHILNHALAKGMLFLLAGNILGRYQSKSIGQVRGVLAAQPLTGFLWMAGFLAIAGFPPFGTFFSELLVLQGMLDPARPLLAAVYLVFLAVVFAALSSPMTGMAQGDPPDSLPDAPPEDWTALAPPLFLCLLVLLLGFLLPAPLRDLIREAAHTLGGRW
jgi:hydrogenase-4 component F